MAPLWPPPPPALPQLLSRPILDTLGFQKVLVFPGHLSVSHLVSCFGPPATMTALGPEFFSCPASPEAGGEWSAAGCSVVASHAEFTSCSCNHTTNFAVLLQVYEVQVRYPAHWGVGQSKGQLGWRTVGDLSWVVSISKQRSAEEESTLKTLTFVGCGVSFCALSVTFILFLAVG